MGGLPSARLARLVRMLTLLSSGSYYSVQELAIELEVSRRTIFRDLNALREARVEVAIDEASNSYYVPGQRGQGQPPLNETQVAWLALAAHLSPLNGIASRAAKIHSSIAALTSHLPAAAQQRIGRLLLSCRLIGAEPTSPGVAAIIEQVIEGICCRRQLRITIREDGKSSQTMVAPYRLEALVGGWVLVGRSTVHRAVRCFDVASVTRVELTDDTYVAPANLRHKYSEHVKPRPDRRMMSDMSK